MNFLKISLSAFALFLIPFYAWAQPASPVTWKFEKEKISDTEYKIIIEATIEDGWAIYSPNIDPDVGPVPTTIEFLSSDFFETSGDLIESENVQTKMDKVWGAEISKFTEWATFTQNVKINSDNGNIEGILNFMACDDEQCLPPKDVDFKITIGQVSTIPTEQSGIEKEAGFMGFFDAKRDNIDSASYESDCGAGEVIESNSLWSYLIKGFLGGLIAILTPCVFPMIPLTVSFFTNSGGSKSAGVRKAILYGLSIIFIYVILGTALTAIFGPTVLNRLSVDPFFNVFFFLMLVFFAISFFGFFELTLPSSWVNKADQAADKGGLLGIFFMAGTLALVSFSCTGPIIGTLLVDAAREASQSGLLLGFIPVAPVVGMFGFALALALPFTLFALFPSWLASLPKSGSWMNNVKVTLGFLELAFAFKFLSVADMVRHWGILKYELFMGIWVVIFLGLALYHFGLIRFPHHPPKQKIGAIRLGIGTLSLIFAGMIGNALRTYAPMPVASGLAPPVHYNYFKPMDCPYGLDCYKDFDKGVAAAQEQGKPLFVDFTGYGCVNCRDVEENVWIDPKIKSKLADDYVVVSLYVDDQARLFPDDKRKFLYDQFADTRLRTVGSQWGSFQVNNFNISGQPYYVLMDNDGSALLNKPVAYKQARDIDRFEAFLDCGLTAFDSISN